MFELLFLFLTLALLFMLPYLFLAPPTKNEKHMKIDNEYNIAIIDPITGKVVRWIDLTGLSEGILTLPLRRRVLNGIAYDAVEKRLFVTGKLWPTLFEIKLHIKSPK